MVDILDHNITPQGKPVSDILEAEAHMKTFEEMLKSTNQLKDLDLKLLLFWHKSLFQSTKPNIAGYFRNGPIYITGSQYIPPASGIEVNILLEELLQWFSTNWREIPPLLLASLMHFRFESIHPFEDGNGRVGRFLMNYILYKLNYPLFDIAFNTRLSYFHALERANIKQDEIIFVQWFVSHYLRANEKWEK